MTTREAVERFLVHRRVALAGASRGGKKFGNAILRTLAEQGYEVTPVHPAAESIEGHLCVPRVTDLPEDVRALVLCVGAEPALALVEDAVAHGIETIWIQQGGGSPAAAALARAHGIETVENECLLMFARPGGLHRVHRWIWAALGKLPRAEDPTVEVERT